MSTGIKVAAPQIGDNKTLIKFPKGKKGPTLNMTTRLDLTDKDLGN